MGIAPRLRTAPERQVLPACEKSARISALSSITVTGRTVTIWRRQYSSWTIAVPGRHGPVSALYMPALSSAAHLGPPAASLTNLCAPRTQRADPRDLGPGPGLPVRGAA